jgi:hypothetical protein
MDVLMDSKTLKEKAGKESNKVAIAKKWCSSLLFNTWLNQT